MGVCGWASLRRSRSWAVRWKLRLSVTEKTRTHTSHCSVDRSWMCTTQTLGQLQASSNVSAVEPDQPRLHRQAGAAAAEWLWSVGGPQRRTVKVLLHYWTFFPAPLPHLRSSPSALSCRDISRDARQAASTFLSVSRETAQRRRWSHWAACASRFTFNSL